MNDMESTDPFTRELIREGLASICEEMAVSIVRTSHSEIVKSAMDFSTAVCNAKGEIIAQGVMLPNQLGALPDAVAAALGEFEGSLYPGDIVMLNDPYTGGMHLPDVFIMKPVFYESEMVALVATVAHHTDVGGLVPGSMSPYADEIYQEGLRIPPVKLYSQGQPDHGLFAVLRANTRVPEILLGDFSAQLVACDSGEAGIVDMVGHHGLDLFDAHVQTLLDYTEELTRQEIRSFPDGQYTFTDCLDDDGVRDDPVLIAVSIMIKDGDVILDFEGTSPQVMASLNSTLSFTKSCSYAAIRTLLRLDIPDNAGFFRPIEVKAPLGSIVNCALPAATGHRGLTGFRIMDIVFGALAPIVPERAMAASDGGLSLIGIGGSRSNGDPFSVLELVSGAWGGQESHDGQDGVPNLGANVSNIPIEMVEAAAPVRIERYGYVPDTGGAGEHRGGVSVEREVTFLGDAVLSVRSDRAKVLPYGIGLGRPGTPSANRFWTGDNEVLKPSKFSQTVSAGDRLNHRTAGAGGWGDPLERDPQDTLRDVRNGLLSIERARTAYGVVVTDTGEIDVALTDAERKDHRSTQPEQQQSSLPTPLEARMV